MSDFDQFCHDIGLSKRQADIFKDLIWVEYMFDTDTLSYEETKELWTREGWQLVPLF